MTGLSSLGSQILEATREVTASYGWQDKMPLIYKYVKMSLHVVKAQLSYCNNFQM